MLVSYTTPYLMPTHPLPQALETLILDMLDGEDCLKAVTVNKEFSKRLNRPLAKSLTIKYFPVSIRYLSRETVAWDHILRQQRLFTRQCQSGFTVSSLLGKHASGVCGIDADEHFIYSAACDSTVRVRERRSLTHKKVYILRHPQSVRCINIGKNLIVSGCGQHIYLWKKNSWNHLSTLKRHAYEITALSLEENFLVSGSGNGKIYTWDIEKMSYITAIKHHHYKVTHLATYNNLLISSGRDGMLYMIDLRAPNETQNAFIHSDPVTHFQDEDSRLFSSSGKTITIWDTRHYNHRLSAYSAPSSITSFQVVEKDTLFFGSKETAAVHVVPILKEKESKTEVYSLKNSVSYEDARLNVIQVGDRRILGGTSNGEIVQWA